MINYKDLAKQVIDDKECRDLIVSALIEEMNTRNAAKNWVKLISFLISLATLATSAIIVERIKLWIH